MDDGQLPLSSLKHALGVASCTGSNDGLGHEADERVSTNVEPWRTLMNPGSMREIKPFNGISVQLLIPVGSKEHLVLHVSISAHAGF